MSVLRNKNINLNAEIDFIKSRKYFTVNTYKQLKILQNEVYEKLDKKRGIFKNYATGFEAKVTRATIDKIIKPKPNFNPFNRQYIDDLNAACYLDKLFKNAVYLDTLKPMKNKVNNANELGYHHFVAPLKMNGECYKAFITVREKINSKILYVISVKIFKFDYKFVTISVKELIDNTSIWNYDLNSYNYYSYSNFVAEGLAHYSPMWVID